MEDESVIALNLQRILVRLGYRVIGIAGSGADAVTIAETEHPDLVLMDINLGKGIDGIEAAAQLSSDRNSAVIYLTAYSEDATLKRAGDTRPYGYLLKPFSERELHATIQMAISRHQADEALAEAEERLRLALDVAEMGSWELDIDTGKLQRQGLTDKIFGIAAESFDGSWSSLLSCVAPEDRIVFQQAQTEALDQGNLMSVEFRALHADGTRPWLRAQARRYLRNPAPKRLIGVVQDITADRLTNAALRQAATVFSSSKDAIFIADIHLRLLAVNDAFHTITGHLAADVIGKKVEDLLVRTTVGQRTLDLSTTLKPDKHWQGEIVAQRRSGDSFPAWLSMTLIPGKDGDYPRVVGIIADISALRRAEEQLLHLAHHDSLTDLPNRLLAKDRLNQAMRRARRYKWRTAVMMIDLDHFKRINDTLGHATGDQVLCEVAMRLKLCLRDQDTVARLGGDEFVVILENIGLDFYIGGVANKLLERIGEPLSLCNREITPRASIGISVFPDDAEDFDSLLRAADTAMYVAKQEGRQRFSFYASEMTDKLTRFVAAEQDLRRGFAAGELRVHYQPQIAVSDLRLVGFEALVRWQHPMRGLLMASEIIPVAEESGLIGEIGIFVLNTVCQQIRSWIDVGLKPPLVAVNVSVHQFKLGSFPEAVVAALANAGIGAERLELELTESTLQQEDICGPALQALDKLGVLLSIDDFGTGYSSLASLRRLPVSRCKIDRAFVTHIAEDSSDAAIAAAIIDMGHRLNVQIIAEGVETQAQMDVLRRLGCDDVQGYLFAKPMPAEDVEHLLPSTAKTGPKGAGTH